MNSDRSNSEANVDWREAVPVDTGSRHTLFAPAMPALFPGARALPGVTIASAASSAGPGEGVGFRPGELYAFETMPRAGRGEPVEVVFLSPVVAQDPPGIRMVPLSRSNAWSCEFRVDTSRGSGGPAVTCAWIPRFGQGTAEASAMEQLSRVVNLKQKIASLLCVEVVTKKGSARITPEWGLSSGALEPCIESLHFALTYAREMLAPFFFRIAPAVLERFGGNKQGGAVEDRLRIRMSLSPEEMAGIMRSAGGEPAGISGVTIVANALPMFNLDLKAWEPQESIEQLARSSGTVPIGLAGLAKFKERNGARAHSEGLDLEPGPFLENAAHVAFGCSEAGSTNLQPSGIGLSGDRQLMVWTTHGDRLNGRQLRYPQIELVQICQRHNDCLRFCRTAVPLFAGQTCPHQSAADVGHFFLGTAAGTDNRLFHREFLRNSIQEMLGRLEGEPVLASSPQGEVRVDEGVRRRVTAVYVQAKSGRSVRGQSIRVAQEYLNSSLPCGVKVVIDVL